LKILQRSDASKVTSVLQLLRSRKEAMDTVDLRQVPIPEADWSVLASSQGPLDPVAEEGRGENEVMQPVTPLETLQPMLQPTQWLMLHETPWLMPLAMPPTMHPMLLTSRETLHQIQDAMQELSLLWSRPIVEREVGATA
jgi:hypothetical protein